MTPDELRDRIIAALLDGGLPPLPASRLADTVLPVVREAIAAELDAFAVDLADEALVRGRRGPSVIADWILWAASARVARCRAGQ